LSKKPHTEETTIRTNAEIEEEEREIEGSRVR